MRAISIRTALVNLMIVISLLAAGCAPDSAAPKPAGELPNITRWPLEIKETFDSGAGSGFSLYSESYGQMDQSGGNLCLIITQPGRYNWASQGDFTDFAVDAVITSLSEGASGGLIFRAALAEISFYAFEINTRGEFRVARLDPGKPSGLTPAVPSWIPIVDWKKSEYIQTGTARNQLTVIAAGEDFWFFINHEVVTSFQDEALAFGGAGILAQSGEESGASVCFDDFHVFLSVKSH